ncbi:SLATT domain-containing protein [Deinococcus aquaticus]|uniref:SLATT domain-containing protein n=1 Tax=Deinococcus aquaticus TaxID=328692 RepID=UPI003F46AE7E
METASQSEKRAFEKYGDLYIQIKKLYGNTIYSHKTQEKQADLLNDAFHKISLANQVLAGLTTGSLILAIFSGTRWETILGSLFGTVNFIITMRLQAVNFPKLSSNHSKAAQNIWSVRERLNSLLTDMHDGAVTAEIVREKRGEVLHDLNTIYADAPRTTPRAFAAAQAALQGSEHNYTEEELRSLTN